MRSLSIPRSGPLAARCSRSWALALVLGGCWKDEFAEIPRDVLRFEPEIPAPLDWFVAPLPLPLECPDGEDAVFYVLYPQAAVDSGAPMPMAMLFTSGAFDFVYAPDPSRPLDGTHFAIPSRLDTAWAVHQVFATLGMYPVPEETEVHDGRIAVGLAERNVAVVLPANCWGDLWANERATTENDFTADFFFREGRSAAEWSYRMAVDPAFASAFDVTFPVAVDPTQTYAIGLAEGSRAVAELLSMDDDDNGVPDLPIAGALVDSPPDDLRVYFADAGLYASTVEGLLRVFPDGSGATASGSLWSAPLPDRLGVAWSTADPLLPADLVVALDGRLRETDWRYQTDEELHVLLDGALADAEPTEAALDHLLGVGR